VTNARLGILLSGSGSTYENLAVACREGRIAAEIAVVVASRADLGGCERARRLGHPLVVAAQPEQVTAALRSHGAGWVAMCGWLKYWDPPADFAERTVNVHPSLLPSFGGKGMYGTKVHTAVLAHGCAVSGCTVHLVAGGYDTGPILAQRAVPVLPDDTPCTLAARVQEAERALYPAAIQELIAGRTRRLADGRLALAQAIGGSQA
jgi:formyltetrahydrofolate-dependent phosphoribosylglycinamide formyltransferase